MTRTARALLLALTTLLTTMLTTGLLAPAAHAGGAQELDGVRLAWLPSGLGSSTDFTYEFDDVDFRSRDWESRTPDGGWRVDASIDTMRGQHLSTPRELHDWFIAYEERPPAEAVYVPTTVHGHRGWVSRDEIFWWVRPGFAMVVRLDVDRWTHRDLLHTALAVRTQASAPLSGAISAGR